MVFENFDATLLNSQWPILTEAGSSRQEDNRKPIKKKAKPKKMAGVLYPQIGNTLNAYRIDYGVFCYQLPPDSPNGASRLDTMRFWRTWFLNQLVLLREEKFDARTEEQSAIIGSVSLGHLTRKIAASRKYDVVAFFYFGPLPERFEATEWALVRKTGNGRCLPPTLDAMLPRYLIVLVDLIGERKSTFKAAPFWSRLERATVTVLVAAGIVRGCSYLISTIREWPYDAVYIISTIIPKKQITVIDVTQSAAQANPEKKEYGSTLSLRYVATYETIQESLYTAFWRSTVLKV